MPPKGQNASLPTALISKARNHSCRWPIQDKAEASRSVHTFPCFYASFDIVPVSGQSVFHRELLDTVAKPRGSMDQARAALNNAVAIAMRGKELAMNHSFDR